MGSSLLIPLIIPYSPSPLVFLTSLSLKNVSSLLTPLIPLTTPSLFLSLKLNSLMKLSSLKSPPLLKSLSPIFLNLPTPLKLLMLKLLFLVLSLSPLTAPTSINESTPLLKNFLDRPLLSNIKALSSISITVYTSLIRNQLYDTLSRQSTPRYNL